MPLKKPLLASACALTASKEILPFTFGATRDIRDKYVLSRLAFDLGVTDILLEDLT